MWISSHTLQMLVLHLQPFKTLVSLIFPFTSSLEIIWPIFFITIILYQVLLKI